jgi:hypothetical protein
MQRPCTAFRLFLFLDGQWSPWEEWSECDKDCGGGMKRRYRQCKGLSDTGKYCAKSNREEKVCNTKPCKIGKSVFVYHTLLKSSGVLSRR